MLFLCSVVPFLLTASPAFAADDTKLAKEVLRKLNTLEWNSDQLDTTNQVDKAHPKYSTSNILRNMSLRLDRRRHDESRRLSLASVWSSVWTELRELLTAILDASTKDDSKVYSNETAAEKCGIPRFIGDWEAGKEYPIPVAEAQGGMIGDDFVLISGFSIGWDQTTNKNYALDTTDSNAEWRELADFPITEGVTHGAFAVVGQKFYMCGGYLGGHPGQEIADCLVYDHSVQPKGEWTFFASLPKGRAGGGMVFDSTKNELVFASGAVRPVAGKADALDQNDAWAYSLSSPETGWIKKADIPYHANHMSYVTAKDENGQERHFFVAGQIDENEHSGNVKDHYEWDSVDEKWIKRADMPFTRGHASSSTRPIACGYIIAAGSTNEFGKTKDVSYYDIPSNTWIKIGDLPQEVNTPVCDIKDGYFFCESGKVNSKLSYKRQIMVEHDKLM